MYIVPTLCLELLSAGQVGRHVLLEGEVGDDGCLGHHAECGLRALAYHTIDTLHRGREGGGEGGRGGGRERTYTYIIHVHIYACVYVHVYTYTYCNSDKC